MDTLLEPAPPVRRRKHSPEFKARVVAACRQPGVSIAAIALQNGLNANLLRRWVAMAEGRLPPRPVNATIPTGEPRVETNHSFVPVALPSGSGSGEVRIELQRGEWRISVTWPTREATACANWLRELLR